MHHLDMTKYFAFLSFIAFILYFIIIISNLTMQFYILLNLCKHEKKKTNKQTENWVIRMEAST